jgi:hypothetical protein
MASAPVAAGRRGVLRLPGGEPGRAVGEPGDHGQIVADDVVHLA